MNIPIHHVELIDGQALIAGRQVKVKMVVNMHLRGGASLEEVIEQYHLTAAEVHAALTYYYDNQDSFDRQYEEDQELLHNTGTPADKHLEQIRSRLLK